LSQSSGSRNSRSRAYLSLSQSYRSLKSFVVIAAGYELDGPRFECRLGHQSLTDAVLLRACLLLSPFFKAFTYNVDNVQLKYHISNCCYVGTCFVSRVEIRTLKEPRQHNCIQRPSSCRRHIMLIRLNYVH
jgi:hypothetical protein